MAEPVNALELASTEALLAELKRRHDVMAWIARKNLNTTGRYRNALTVHGDAFVAAEMLRALLKCVRLTADHQIGHAYDEMIEAEDRAAPEDDHEALFDDP